MSPRQGSTHIRSQAAIEAEELIGLRLGAIVRAVTMTVIAVWLFFQVPLEEVAFYWVLLAAFILIGWLPYHFRLREGTLDWVFYLFPLLDAALLTYTLIAPNPLDKENLPAAMLLRLGNEIYFFPIIASAVFYYRPVMLIWSGVCVAASWTLGTLWIAAQPDSRLFRWQEYRALSSQQQEIAYFLAPDRVDLNGLGTQIIVFLLVAGCLALLVSRFQGLLIGHAEAERKRSNLTRYFSPNIVEELADADEPLGEARSQNAAVLFADVIGFTRLAEMQSPEKVFELLRELLSLMAHQVFLHNGTLDKYLGDGVMATFGTPRNNGHEARDSLACARAILSDVAAWNHKREAEGQPPLEIGIGIHYGPVVLGNVGDESRLEFAVLGDTVNVASRFERLTRSLNVSLVVSGDLIAALSDQDQQYVRGLTPCRPEKIRGRDRPVPVWTL